MIVFFDIDRTLLDFEKAERAGIMAVYDAYRSDIRMGRDEFYKVWKVWAQRYFDEYSHGRLTFAEQRRARVKKIFELNGSPVRSKEDLETRYDVYRTTQEHTYGLFPDTLPALETLSGAGVPMGIITNGDSAHQRGKLKSTGIERFFSIIVVSSEAGVSKPDYAIFRRALSLASCAASDAFFVGDSPDQDVAPARALGINTFFMNRAREGDALVVSEAPLYAEVKNFDEMIGLFRGRAL